MERPERLDMQSADGTQLNLDALYQIAPSCFTEVTDPKTGKIKRVVNRVDESNFEDVERTPKEYNQDQLDLFLNNVKSDRTDLDLLFGCMLDWGVQLSLPMSSEEVDGKMIYTVNDGDLVACFADKVTDSVVKAMADKQPLRVIFRDSCFEQDADKINI